MHIDEFQELGFSVAWRFPEGTSEEEQIDQTVNDLIEEVIEPNKLAFDGSGYLSWEGLICMQEIGKCTEEHQAIVRKWLEARKLEDVRTSELLTSGGTKFDKGRQLPARFVLRSFMMRKTLLAVALSITALSAHADYQCSDHAA